MVFTAKVSAALTIYKQLVYDYQNNYIFFSKRLQKGVRHGRIYSINSYSIRRSSLQKAVILFLSSKTLFLQI